MSWKNKNIAFGACDECGDDVVIDTSPMCGCPICDGEIDEAGQCENGCDPEEYQWIAWDGDTAACGTCGKKYTVGGIGERGWLVEVPDAT